MYNTHRKCELSTGNKSKVTLQIAPTWSHSSHLQLALHRHTICPFVFSATSFLRLHQRVLKSFIFIHLLHSCYFLKFKCNLVDTKWKLYCNLYHEYFHQLQLGFAHLLYSSSRYRATRASHCTWWISPMFTPPFGCSLVLLTKYL